jgi:hypothetical protein
MLDAWMPMHWRMLVLQWLGVWLVWLAAVETQLLINRRMSRQDGQSHRIKV